MGTMRAATATSRGSRGRAGTLRALIDFPRALDAVAGAPGDVARLDVGRLAIGYVKEPALARAALDTRLAGVAERGRFYDEISRVIGTSSLVVCAGERHRRLRRLLAPAFRPEQVAIAAETMVAATAQLSASWQPGATIDVGRAMSDLTLEIAARALLGLERAAQVEDIATVLHTGTRVFYRLLLPPALSARLWRSPYSIANRRLFAAQARVDAFVYDLLDRRATQVERDDHDRASNLLDVLCAARDPDGGRLSLDELRDQVVTFLFAGHETTAQALTWALVELGRHPAVQARLRAECAQVAPGRDPGRADLPRLSYARAVVRETLRLHPPAWFLAREMSTDGEVGGCPLPRGALIVVSPLALHRDSRRWDDPLAFVPERFLGELDEEALASYVPFGHGRRNCIGSSFALTEMTLVLSTLAGRVRLEVLDAARVGERATVTLRPRRRVRALVVPCAPSGATAPLRPPRPHPPTP
jgi:pentalenene oxygenase